MLIKLKTHVGDELRVHHATTGDTIENLKSKILKAYGIPVEEQNIIVVDSHGDFIPADHVSLSTCDIGENSTVHLVVCKGYDQRMSVHIKPVVPGGQQMVIDNASPSDTFANLKSKISCKYNIPATRQRLIVDEEDPDDDLLLSDWGLAHGSTVYFTHRTSYSVHVKVIGKKDLTLLMDASSTVRDLRRKIASETSISMEQQQLILRTRNKQIQELDTWTLCDVGFSLDDTNNVDLTASMRGGEALS